MSSRAHGKREGPAGDESCVSRTKDTVGGSGVERSGTESSGRLYPRASYYSKIDKAAGWAALDGYR